MDKATKQVIIHKLANKRAKSVVEAFSDIVVNTFCEFKTLIAAARSLASASWLVRISGISRWLSSWR
ncbi:hypothetical protein BBW68_11395 [Candidatus Erwinia dacicola]|uniref:Uncharacterized protein n=1 Tax=Candidatus Erwinia dacicola TaxID=252393 RepID=A0A1E7Z012_9GAMM|nr:hypothetical protein BBW68_11395 [Candidatus Erwinia dacicola]